MKSFKNFISEKFIINSKTAKSIKNLENWSIDKADDGDFVNYNGTELYFIYKCLNNELDKPKSLNGDTIIYHVAYNFNLKHLDIGPSAGVGDIKRTENYSLASDEKKEEFIKILKDHDYEWDDSKKELIKV